MVQPFNPPLTDSFGLVLNEVMTTIGPPFPLFYHPITMSNRRWSSIILQPIPSSLGTQGGVSITLPMSSIFGSVTSTVAMTTSPFFIWGTSLVPFVTSTLFPCVSPPSLSSQSFVSRFQFGSGQISPAHTGSDIQSTPRIHTRQLPIPSIGFP